MKGTIIGFYGSYGSGIATLSIKTETGEHKMVPCDNGPTVRALDAIFGNVIGPGHSVNVYAIKGKKIRYEMDDMGLVLGWIAPDEGIEKALNEELEKVS